MYKALVTDLDGTVVGLASHGTDISDSTKHSIAQAQQQKCIVAAATGRTWEFAKPVIQALGLHDPCIIEGGTRIVDPVHETTLWEQFLDDQATDRVIEVVRQAASDTRTAFAGDQNQSIVDPQPVSDIKARLHVRILYFLGIDRSKAEQIAQDINGNDNAVAHLTPSWAGASKLDIHVTHPEATKEHALVIWHELVGVSKAETIAMGDSSNDIPLFQATGLKVAVDNATPDLKQQADIIGPAQDKEALHQIIEKYLLT